VAQITYACPSWRGFIKAQETARLKAVLLKARRYGYLHTDFHSLEDLLDSSDESLFRSFRYNTQQVLHQLLPPPKHTGYNLRSRGHGLTLSVIPSEFMRKNFINRMLMLYRQDCTLVILMLILYVYRVAQNKIPHKTICNISTTSGLILKILEAT